MESIRMPMMIWNEPNSRGANLPAGVSIHQDLKALEVFTETMGGSLEPGMGQPMFVEIGAEVADFIASRLNGTAYDPNMRNAFEFAKKLAGRIEGAKCHDER